MTKILRPFAKLLIRFTICTPVVLKGRTIRKVMGGGDGEKTAKIHARENAKK